MTHHEARRRDTRQCDRHPHQSPLTVPRRRTTRHVTVEGQRPPALHLKRDFALDGLRRRAHAAMHNNAAATRRAEHQYCATTHKRKRCTRELDARQSNYSRSCERARCHCASTHGRCHVASVIRSGRDRRRGDGMPSNRLAIDARKVGCRLRTASTRCAVTACCAATDASTAPRHDCTQQHRRRHCTKHTIAAAAAARRPHYGLHGHGMRVRHLMVATSAPPPRQIETP
jgi:hypothetical protein